MSHQMAGFEETLRWVIHCHGNPRRRRATLWRSPARASRGGLMASSSCWAPTSLRAHMTLANRRFSKSSCGNCRRTPASSRFGTNRSPSSFPATRRGTKHLTYHVVEMSNNTDNTRSMEDGRPRDRCAPARRCSSRQGAGRSPFPRRPKRKRDPWRQMGIGREVDPTPASILNVPPTIERPFAPSETPHRPQTQRSGPRGTTRLPLHNVKQQVVPL